MALYQAVVQPDGHIRLRDLATGEYVARIFDVTLGLRLERDATLAEAVWNARTLGAAARRSAVRAAFATWQAAGGRVEDLRGLGRVVADSNQTLELAGERVGYFHGEIYPAVRPLRFVTLAEDVVEAEALGTNTARNTALDAAVTRFVNAGGIT